MEEFVCEDGRMSVNGICVLETPGDNGQDEIIETTKPKHIPPEAITGEKIPQMNQEIISPHLIDQSIVPTSDIKHIPPESITHNKIPTVDKTLDQVENIIEKTTPKKNKFDWQFDKDQKIDNYKNTVNNNITEYNQWVETNLGISSDLQNAVRAGSTMAALSGGTGVLGVAAPWALPILMGGALNNAENKRIQDITDQDKQGDIEVIDMMSYNTPQPGDEGFNIHNDAGDKTNTPPKGPSNKHESDYGYGSDAGWY